MMENRSKIPIRDITVFAALGAIMYASKWIMMGIPNVHPLALFIAAITLTYGVRALIPIYVFVLLFGLFEGFTMWFFGYLYVWIPLWLAFFILKKLNVKYNIPKIVQVTVYIVVCGLHGFSFGTLLAPVQAFFFGLNFQGMIAWIIAGLPFDGWHAIGNAAAALLVIPLTELLKKLSGNEISHGNQKQ